MRFRIPKISSIVYRVKELYFFLVSAFNLFTERLTVYCHILQLRRRRSSVWIGANYDSLTSGVGIHMHAIERYSGLKIERIPSDLLLTKIGKHEFQTNYFPLFCKYASQNLRVVHSHVYPWFIKWCREHKKDGLRWIHTYHALYFPECNNGSLFEWQKEYNEVMLSEGRQADVCISITKYQQVLLKELYNIDTVYIPNGVDVALCDLATGERFTVQTGLSNYILSVSRNDPVKNPLEFVRLAIEMPNYSFVMIGPGLSQELFAEEYQVETPQNLVILAGMPHASIQDAIAACSVLVSTSIREGLPTIVLEGMTHAKPVVVSNEPGGMEAIGHGQYGYFYTLGDIHEMRQSVLAALQDAGKPPMARRRVLEEYDWKVVASKLDALYKGDFISC